MNIGTPRPGLAKPPRPSIATTSAKSLPTDSAMNEGLPGLTRTTQWHKLPTSVVLQAMGLALVVAWCIWMVQSFHRHDLKGFGPLWFNPYFGIDFYRHIDRHARILWDGSNPYSDKIAICCYPPMVYRLFAWVNLTTPRVALGIWLALLTLIFAAGAWVAANTRERLGLTRIPAALVIALTLFSTPVLFALERGQCDPLSVAFIVLALPLLGHRSIAMQFLAGAILCMAPWTKVYPGLLIVALAGLRHWWALAAFVVVGAGIGILDFSAVQDFLVVNREHMDGAERLARLGGPGDTNHSLPLAIYNRLYQKLHIESTAAMLLGRIAAATLLFPLLAWVSWHVYRCPRRTAVTYPYMLWVVALATFAPPISNDYNITVLPLAVLAIWDRRDSWFVQIGLAFLLLWWQPLALDIGGREMLAIKLLGLAATAVCLVERTARLRMSEDIRETAESVETPQEARTLATAAT